MVQLEPVVTWDLDPILLRGGSIPLRYYGLIFALTVVAGFFLFRWQMRRGGHPDQQSGVFLGYALAATLVGARLGHCLFYDLERSLQSYGLFVLKVWQGGLSSHGATAGLVVAIWLFSRRSSIPLAEVTDRFSFSAALGACTIRVANFLNSEIVGRPTDGTWGVRFPRHDRGLPLSQVPLRHPSQLYEAALGLGVLAALLAVDRRQHRRSGGKARSAAAESARPGRRPGETEHRRSGGKARSAAAESARPGRRPGRRGLLSALFLTLYFSGRLVVELFKEHQALAPGSPVTMGQILSVPPLLWGAIWLGRLAFGSGIRTAPDR
jgi:prolipoprotein diacylglyceryl transferase